MFESLSDARLLVEAARHLSFAEAGRKLAMPPATISRRIAALEEAAGAKLFERTTRKVSVTEAGAMLVQHAQRILDEADAASSALEAMQSTPSGEVRIAAPVVLGQALLGPIVREFLEGNPACRISLNLTNRQVDLVEEGYDIAVRAREPGDADLVARKLGTATTGLFADRRSRSPEITRTAQLQGRDIAFAQPESAPRDKLALTSAAGRTEAIGITCRMWSPNPWVVSDATRETDLIALLPTMVGSQDSDFKQLLTEWHGPQVDVFAVFLSRRLMRPAVRAFIDLLAERTPALLT